MPRQRSNATDEKDARVTAAVDAYLEKKYNSITKAVKAFNAPVLTVKYRVTVDKHASKAMSSNRY